jgi:predicted acyl esterase
LRIPAVPKGVGGSLSIYLYTERADTLRRIGWGQVDLRFPHGRGKPQPVGPGERVSIDVRLQPLDAMLARGERLVLMVSMANSYNRLPLPGAPVELDVGGASASLELLHVTPKRSQFFTPPKPRISLG